MEETLYLLNGVTQQYGTRTVLSVDQLEVRSGEILALVGPSGAGKSTLLRLLAFLEQPSRGTLAFRGMHCEGSWPTLEARRQVAMVFQRPQLLRRSVRDNVAYGLELRGVSSSERVTAIVEELGLESVASARAQTLSGGELQRTALARALVLEPEILLLDEPTANLDPYNVRLIEEMTLKANRAAGATVVIVTHNIFQARRLAHRVGLLLNGQLIEVSSVQAFFEAPRHPQTAAFVNGEMVY